MSTIGLDCLFYAPIQYDDEGNEIYGMPRRLAKAITANLTVNTAETQLTADGMCVNRTLTFDGGKIALGIDELGSIGAAALLGAKLDNNGVAISSKEDSPQPVAVGFRSRKSDGTYKYVWLYSVVFSLPATDAATRAENISYSTQKIEGIISRRRKPDFNGDHPWKAELDETDNMWSYNILAQANQAPQGVLLRSANTEKLSSGYKINRAAGLTIASSVDYWFRQVYEPNGFYAESQIRDTDMAEEMV